MSESITIVQVNPYIFISSFVEAVQQGYLLELSNRGWISEGTLKEITLFKDPERVLPTLELGEFTISEYDTQTFLHKLCEYIAQGGKIDLDSLYWDVVGIKSVRGKMYLKGDFTKEDLAQQDWDTFKASVKTIGITGRDRNLMLTKYLQMTGQEV